MQPTSTLLGIALLIVVLPFILEPFFRQRRGQRRTAAAAANASAGTSAIMTKDSALVALRDLDFDFQTGKVTEADYAPMRQQLLLAAAEAAQRERPARQSVRRTGAPRDAADIEAAARPPRQRSPRATADRAKLDPDADIEAAVQAVRLGRRSCPACGTPATAADKFCGRCGAGLDRACPACRALVRPVDAFCAKCGATLDTQVDIKP